VLPVHEQLREDAALGAAWRRAEAAIPADCWLEEVCRAARGGWQAIVWNKADQPTEICFGSTPTAALEALAEALEARAAQ
jgi:hypothetical protein